ncbi:MAG: 50S ribosomal protein L15 [Thermodesulfobacteriota bacterium]
MLEKLSPSKGSKKSTKRIGRGFGSQGRQSGKGHKGQRSRSGRSVSRWFEGGQTPLKLRVPKRGFKNRFKKSFDLINVKNLSVFDDGQTVSKDDLVSKGLVSGKNDIKLLGNGDLDKKVTVQVNAASKLAQEKVEKSGGKVEII